MIICPNCNHQNPEGSVQCESCYTPLPSTSPCPNCGALVQTDATFCGQCGFNLQGSETAIPQATNNFMEEAQVTAVNSSDQFQSPWDEIVEELEESSFPEKTTIPPNLDFVAEEEPLEEIANDTENTADLESWLASMQLEEEESPQENKSDIEEIPDLFVSESMSSESEPEVVESQIPETSIPDFASEPELPIAEASPEPDIFETSIPDFASEPEIPVPDFASEVESEPEPELDIPGLSISELETAPEPLAVEETSEPAIVEPEPDIPGLSISELETAPESETSATESTNLPLMNNPPNNTDASTRLQLQKAVLSHVQTETNLEIPLNLPIIRIGKPNNQVPPDIDVSGFPNAEIVSRIHAEIRVEGDTYFVEDRGSSNGTYVNHSPLLTGNRHRLRPGDRISLGKGDLMTFIFQVEQL